MNLQCNDLYLMLLYAISTTAQTNSQWVFLVGQRIDSEIRQMGKIGLANVCSLCNPEKYFAAEEEIT